MTKSEDKKQLFALNDENIENMAENDVEYWLEKIEHSFEEYTEENYKKERLKNVIEELKDEDPLYHFAFDTAINPTRRGNIENLSLDDTNEKEFVSILFQIFFCTLFLFYDKTYNKTQRHII